MQVRLMAIALGVLGVVACSGESGTGSETSDPSSSPSDTTLPSTAGPPGAPDEATPVRLPEHDGFDWRIAIAPDGETALLARSEGFFPQTRESTLVELRRQPDGSWGDPVEPSFVAGTSSDIDPFYSPNGSRVWFSSIRPVDGVARDDVEVWSVDRRPDGTWEEPVHVAVLDSPGDDLYPSLGPDGSLYVGSDRGGTGFDIWRAAAQPDGTWAAPAPLPAPITTAQWELNPVLTPDGSALVFTAQGRAGGAGQGDLFVSRLAGDEWSEPEPITAVNTSGDEYHPAFSPDGSVLFFVRDGTLYEIATSATEVAG